MNTVVHVPSMLICTSVWQKFTSTDLLSWFLRTAVTLKRAAVVDRCMRAVSSRTLTTTSSGRAASHGTGGGLEAQPPTPNQIAKLIKVEGARILYMNTSLTTRIVSRSA